MKNWKLVSVLITLFSSVLSGQTSAIYNLGNIGTEYNVNPSPAVESGCTDTLTVNITPGDLVVGVDVSYNMTTVFPGWMSEQSSYIECVTTGIKEATVYDGVGNTAGTMSYNRNGLNIANGISATGELKFVIHAFRSFGNIGQCNAAIARVDNNSWTITVNHIPPPTCPFPTNVQVQSVGVNSALVNWTTGGATNWQIEYGPAGFTPGNGTVVSATTNPFRINGLASFTQYDFYVRDSCAPGDVSIWTQGPTFRTLCTPVLAPWVNNFQGAPWVPGTGFFNNGDGINACFERDPEGIPVGTFAGEYFWGARQGATSGFQSGPSVDHTLGTASGKYIFTVAALADPGDQAFMTTRLVDLSPLTVPELRFWYHMFGADIGTLRVEVDNGTGFSQVWSLSGPQQNAKTDAWQEAIVPLPQFAGDTIRVRFVGISINGGLNGEMAIDDISLDEAPSCPQPNGLQALSVGAQNVVLDWQPGTASNWNVIYGPAGFALGTGTIVNAATHPFNLTGLSPNTNYDIYVRDSCGVGDVSVWIGPLTIRTNCLPFATPYTMNFDGVAWIPGTNFNNGGDQINPCWSRDPGQQTGFTGAYFWGTGTGQTNTFNTGPNADHTTGNGKYIFIESSFGATGDEAEIVSPLIDLTNLTVPELRFWYHLYGGSTGTLKVDVNDGSGWTQVFTLTGQQQTAITAPWLEAIINISAYANDTIQVRFISEKGFGGQGDMAIDDFSVLEAPSCPQPSNLQALAIGSSNVNLDWTSTASNSNISYGAPGTAAGAGTIVNATGAPYNLTGLTPNTSYEIYVRDSCGVGDVSVWIGPILITTACLPLSAPWTETFESAGWVPGTGFANGNDAIDNCWSRDPGGNNGTFGSPFFWGTRSGPTQSFNTGPDFDHTTGSGKYVYTEAGNAGNSAEITSPLIDLTPLNIPELRFWYHMAGTNIGTLDVEVNNGSGWNNVFTLSGAQQTATSSPWLEGIVSLAAYANDTLQVRFRNSNGGFQNDMAIDDVSIIESPNCTQASGLNLVFVSSNSATVGWTTGGASAWQIEYGPVGFTPGTGTLVNALTNPTTLTGLTPNTAYSAFVRDSCAAGSVGVWVGPLVFSTACVPATTPYVENFDGSTWIPGTGAANTNSVIDNCWSRNPGPSTTGNTVYSWGTYTANTTSAGTGPNGDHTTGSGQYVYTEASAPGPAGTLAELESPLIDLTALNVPEMRFWFHMAGTAMGDLFVDVNDGSGYVNVWSQSGAFQNSPTDPWEEAIVSLASYANDTIQIKFRGLKGSSFTSDIAIDDLSIIEAPACPQPTNLQIGFVSSNSVELNWTTGGATNWQIEYGPAGFTPGTGTLVAANTNPFTISGLTPSTAYDFYVRDSCGVGSVSVWEGPEPATTACAVSLAPFSENFDGTTWVTGAGATNNGNTIDPCWLRTPGGSVTGLPSNYSWGTGQGVTPSAGTGPDAGFGGTGQYVFIEASAGANNSIAQLESPLIDLSPLTNPELHFYYHMFGISIDSLKVEVNDGSGYVFLGAIVGQQQTANNAAWLPQTYSLSAYAGSTVRIRFSSRKLGFNGDIAVDEFNVQEAVACPPPFALNFVSTSSSSITLDWTTGGASNWQVEVGPFGFTPGTGNVLNVTSAPPFVINGLNPSTTYQVYVRDSCAAGSVSTWAGPIAGSTKCAVFATPYSEDFENGLWVAGGTFDAGDIDSCWTRNAEDDYWWKGISGPTPTTSTGPSGDHTTGSGTYVYTETTFGNTPNTILTSPEVDLNGLTAPELRFWYHMYGALIDELQVWVDNGSIQTSLLTLNGAQQFNQADPWLEAVVDLSAYVNDTIRLEFRAARNGGANNQVDISIDDITIDEAPACPNPSLLNITASTQTTVTLGWVSGGATNWQIEYGPAGFTPGSGTLVNATTQPFTVTGLSPSTTYDFYVRDSCGLGNVSTWSSVASGSTACGTAVAPYFQNFDTGFDEGTGIDNAGSTVDPCWTRNPATGYHWGGGQGTTPTGNTGPSGDHTSGFGNYVYAEASFTTPGLTAELESPDIDLTPLTLPELRFWYHMFGASTGSLRIDVFNGSAWTTGVDSIVGEQGNQWFEKRIILSSFVGQTIRVRFVATTGVTPTQLGDIAIDDLAIIEAPSCPFPSFLQSTASTTTSVTLSWTSGGATNWQIEYGAPGFTPGTGTLVNANTNPFTVSGLAAGATFDFYVRDSCGLGEVSDWTGPITAATACGVVVAPYSENFDFGFDEGTGNDNAGSTIDPCWSRNPATGYHWGGGQGTTPTGNTGPSADHTTGSGNYVYAEASFTTPGLTAELVSPSIDLTPLTTPELVFWYHMFGASTGDLQLDVFNGTSWVTNVDQIVGEQGNQWFERRVNLSAFAGQTIQLRFVASTGVAPTQFGDIAIDDVTIDEAPSCPAPANFTASVIGDTSVTFAWTSGGAANWQIEYGAAGFTPGTGTVVAVNSNPFTLTGLSPLTSYSFYLRDSCGTGDVSTWVGPLDVSTLNCPVGCTYTLRLTDSFGDGWSTPGAGPDHQLQLVVNGGAPVNYTLPGGTQINYSITFCDNDQFALNFVNNGAWSDECGILLTDPNGAVVYQRNPGTNINSGNLYTDSADCGPVLNCTDPSGLSAQNITLNSANLVFTSNSGVSRIQFGPSGFPLGSGVFVALVTASPFTASGLQPNTTYDFYVQDSCGVGVTSNWVGPITFTTTACPSVTASFTYTVTGTTINVDGTASSGSFFQWDFAGQGSSFDSVATYTFGAEGVYDITLINSNACGSTDTLTVTLDFCAPLAATITENVNLLNAAFVALPSSGVPTQYSWDFGDGSSGSGQSTNHTYATEGTYNVVLTMTNACGDTASSNIQIQLCDSISGDIAFTFSGTTFSFDGSGSSANAVDYQWYFGDGSTDTVVSPTYSYTSSGTYTVSLVVTNACGESDSVSTSVTVCAKPTARWTFSVIQSSPFGMEVQFDASSSTGAVSYFWNFGDGTTNNTSGFPTHTYGTPGFFYVVTLIVYNSCGDSDTLRSSLASIGVDEPEWEEQLLLYPNPTQEFVQISWDGLPNGEEQVQLTVIDAQGKVMAEFSEFTEAGEWNTTLDLRSWASGVYFVRLQCGNRQAMRRIIKD